MRPSVLTLTAATLAVLTAVSAGPAPTRADTLTCHPDWSSAAEIVSREKLMAVEELSRLVRKSLNGDLMTTMLCQDGSRYVYRVTFKSSSGRLRKATVDAKPPFQASVLP